MPVYKSDALISERVKRHYMPQPCRIRHEIATVHSPASERGIHPAETCEDQQAQIDSGTLGIRPLLRPKVRAPAF